MKQRLPPLLALGADAHDRSSTRVGLLRRVHRRVRLFRGRFRRVFNDSASSWRVTIGYQPFRHFAFEGTYGKTSTVRDTVSGSPPGSTVIELETELNKIFGFRLLGTVPFDNGLSLMAGLGFVDLDQDIAFSVNGAPIFGSEIIDESQPTYYFGVQYDWDRVALRLGYEKFDLDIQTDAEEVALSFFYKL